MYGRSSADDLVDGGRHGGDVTDRHARPVSRIVDHVGQVRLPGMHTTGVPQAKSLSGDEPERLRSRPKKTSTWRPSAFPAPLRPGRGGRHSVLRGRAGRGPPGRSSPGSLIGPINRSGRPLAAAAAMARCGAFSGDEASGPDESGPTVCRDIGVRTEHVGVDAVGDHCGREPDQPLEFVARRTATPPHKVDPRPPALIPDSSHENGGVCRVVTIGGSRAERRRQAGQRLIGHHVDRRVAGDARARAGRLRGAGTARRPTDG